MTISSNNCKRLTVSIYENSDKDLILVEKIQRITLKFQCTLITDYEQPVSQLRTNCILMIFFNVCLAKTF